jgi:GNAT superfamily N-acetyltransferase
VTFAVYTPIEGSSVNIRQIQPGDEAAVIDLHRNHYWRDNCLLLNPGFYRWQFAQPPDSAAAGGDQSVVAVDSEGRLLSFLGVVRARASFRGRAIKAAHLITWLSSPAARGRGVGLALMSYMTQTFDFLLGRSVTPAALAVYQRLGFRYFQNCYRWVGILDPEAALSLAVEPSELSAKRAHARRIHEGEAAPVYFVGESPCGAESLAADVLSDSTAFHRTNDYLSWRYEKHPYFRYEFLFVGDASKPEGVAVLRTEDVSGRAGRVLRVVEFIAAPADSCQLATAVFAYGREQRCAYVDCFGMSEYFVAGFVAAGAFSTLEEPDLRLPHLLQPWDADTDPPGLLFFGRRDVGPNVLGPVDDITRIHVSKGDGNMDWPSWTDHRWYCAVNKTAFADY